MLDVMLIREFGVEEINAQGVAKAFVEGCRMVGLLDEHNIIADIDALPNKQSPRRELASPPPSVNSFKTDTVEHSNKSEENRGPNQGISELPTTAEPDAALPHLQAQNRARQAPEIKSPSNDLIASLFGLIDSQSTESTPNRQPEPEAEAASTPAAPVTPPMQQEQPSVPVGTGASVATEYKLQVSGPGVNTALSITEEEDIAIALALLEKIRRQLKARA